MLAIIGAVAVMGGATLYLVTQARTVTVIVDNNAVQTRTYAETVGVLLEQLGVSVGEADQVTPPLDALIAPNTIIRLERARTVFLQIDHETVPILTTLNNPAEILQQAGIVVGNNDRVVVDGTETTPSGLSGWPVPVSHIEVRHSVTVQVVEGGEARLIQTTAATLGDALFAAGITLYTADTITPPLNTSLMNDIEVRIERARPVTLIADGETTQVRSQGATVGDALAQAEIALVGLDYAIPAETAFLLPGMSVRVIRVREAIETTDVPIPFETIYQADATLEIDNFRAGQVGVSGVLHQRTRVRYENEVAVEQASLEDVVAQPAVNRVILYGTNVVIRTIETEQGAREYWRVLRMYATSYHPAALGGDNITSIGKILQKGIVASDPRMVPYGTQIFVSGYGVGEIADTGGPRSFKLWVDLGYSDADWRTWSGYTDVYILTPVPATIDYFLME